MEIGKKHSWEGLYSDIKRRLDPDILAKVDAGSSSEGSLSFRRQDGLETFLVSTPKYPLVGYFGQLPREPFADPSAELQGNARAFLCSFIRSIEQKALSASGVVAYSRRIPERHCPDFAAYFITRFAGLSSQ